MKLDRKQTSISALAALLLFCVFAAGVLSVLLGGAGAYRRLTQRDRLAYDARTCAQFLASKVRQAPSSQAISLTSFGEGDALAITQKLNGASYQTLVYCYDGWLMELFVPSDGDFSPEDGEKLLQAQQLRLEQRGTLLSATLTTSDGTPLTCDLSLRGGKEGAS